MPWSAKAKALLLAQYAPVGSAGRALLAATADVFAAVADRLPEDADAAGLAARFRDAGGVADERLYDRIGHIALVASLARPLQLWASVLDDVDRFLARHPVGDAGCPEQG